MEEKNIFHFIIKWINTMQSQISSNTNMQCPTCHEHFTSIHLNKHEKERLDEFYHCYEKILKLNKERMKKLKQLQSLI